MQGEVAARRWFSLIELLIVIAILAVLISLLLPALRKARDSASAVVCIGNVRTYGFKYMEFIDTTDGVFQLMTNKSEKDYFLPSNDRTVHACPLDDIARRPNAIWGASPLLPISYAINGHLIGYVKLDPQTGFMSWTGSESDYVPLKIQQIRFTSRTVLFGEYTSYYGNVWTPNPGSSGIKYHLNVSAQPAPSGFEADSVVCSATNRNNGRTAWDGKDEIIGRSNCPNIGTAA